MIKIHNYNLHILLKFIIIKTILSQLDECEFDKPIKVGNNCLSTYCTKSQFESGDCQILNSKVKTQWLNNIILVGESDFRFVKFMTSSNGELILATSSCPSNKDRIYYGIDSNGSPIFKDSSNKETYIIKKTIRRDETIQRYETQSGPIKVNGSGGDNNKDYFIHIGKSKTYVEIFDIVDYNKNLIELTYDKITEQNIKSYFGSLINIVESSKNYYILSIINASNKLVLLKLNFEYTSSGSIKCTTIKETPFDAKDSRIVTCYLNNNMIVCAFFSTDSEFTIMILDTSFNSKKEKDLSITSSLSTSFHKLIHLSGNIGLFAYYKGIENDYPSIQIIEAKKSGSSYSINMKGNFNLNKYYFENDALINDFIKIRDNLVALTSPKKDREILIIVLISFYNGIQYNIRYYLINIYEYYHHKIMKDIALEIYNNNLAFAFSYCPQITCDGDSNTHYSSLIFFSYPNINNNDFDIINYLSQEENNNLIINLSDNISIDNNVFGYIFDGIKIYNIDNCGIDFISNKTNETIRNEDILSQNEELELILKEEEYEILSCKISFSLIITEPEYEVYNEYPSFILNENDENEKTYFERNKYEGRIGYLNILINQEITKNCSDENINCDLCLQQNKTSCLLCKGEFKFINNAKSCHLEEIPTSIFTTEIETTEPKILTTEIETTEPKILSTEIEITEPKITTTEIETADPKITEPSITMTEIETTQPKIITTEIEITEPKITTTEIETTQPKITTTEIEASELTFITEKVETTEGIEITDPKEFTEKIEILSSIIIKIGNCYIEEIIEGKCPDIVLTNLELQEIYEYIKKEILNKNYTYKNLIIPTQNVKFQISTLKDQKNTNTYISSVDLQECENILKDTYNIKSDDLLLIFKIDIKSEDYLKTFVQYEIYEPRNFQRLNLSVCNKTEIIVNVPTELDSETLSLYESLNEFGYNLFDSNDPFYNDVCTPYTTLNNTDIILSDRKDIIYANNGNQTLCQTNCSIKDYNTSYKNVVCKCSAQVDDKIPVLEFAKTEFNIYKLSQSFFITIKNSNFLVLKCYKLVFNINNISKNIGMIIMSIIILFVIIFILIFLFKDRNKINIFIESILKLKHHSNNETEKSKISTKIKKDRNNKNKNYSKNNNKKENNSKNNNKKKNNKIKAINKKFIKNKPYHTQSNSKLKLKINKKIKFGPPKKMKSNKSDKTNPKTSKRNIKKDEKKFSNSNQSSYNFIKKDWFKALKTKNVYKSKNNKLTEYEINNLDYKSAIEIDKRKYFQYYWSLLKTKHLILFTFLPAEDYNLVTIKLCLFLISFSLSFTMNGFFLRDETMQRIYEDYGKFNILVQITQILYSTIICAVINTLLKLLSLSESDLLGIKKQKTLKKATFKSKQIKKYIKIKFLIFFILSILLLLFCWYFISCFCIVYNNTQIILITDTLVSFGLSMVYPFGLNLLPGFLRIPSLRAEKKDKLAIYKISLLIALF